jgi:mRNA interferase MazF
LEVKRGDVFHVVFPGAYGKARPAVIIQADMLKQPNSVTFLLLTDEIICDRRLRITINANSDNGLQSTSQVMIEAINTVPRKRVGEKIGHLSAADMTAITRALAVFLGFA